MLIMAGTTCTWSFNVPFKSSANVPVKSSTILSILKQHNAIKWAREEKAMDYPNDTEGNFSAVADGHFIVGGGRDRCSKLHRSVYNYDPKLDAWKSLPNISKARTYAKCLYAAETLFVVGGMGEGYHSLDSVEYFKMNAASQSNCWTYCKTPLPLKVHGHGLIAANDTFYLTGGSDDDDNYFANAFCGNLNSRGSDISWQPLPSMVKTRSYHIFFVHQNQMYVAGGLGEGRNTCECYNPKTDRWTLLSHKLPCDHLIDACATYDNIGNVIITGGYHLDGSFSSKVMSYDPENGFMDIADFEMNEPRYGHVALAMI